jgi:hypothetical protein
MNAVLTTLKQPKDLKLATSAPPRQNRGKSFGRQ